jgi:hypothetical protein
MDSKTASEIESVNDYLNHQRTTPTDPVQKRLTRTHIIPYLPSILSDFKLLREAIDMAVNEFSLRRYGNSLKNLQVPSIDTPQVFYSPMLQSTVDPFLQRQPPENLSNYPIGMCTIITNAAWRLLTKEAFLPNTDGFFRLRAFVSSGGIFHVIWGGFRKKCFQTAFQVGDHYIDISNDTVDIHKPKIDHASLAESGFHDIHTYKEYMGIKADYHHVEIIINNCLPRLFPYFPLFICSGNRRLFSVDANMYMARLNISKGFHTILDLMDDGSFQNQLDKTSCEMIAASVKKMTGSPQYRNWLEFRTMDRDDTVRLLRNCAAHDSAEHIKLLKAAVKVCSFLNHVWAKDDIGQKVLVADKLNKG